jgi:hypothetical protein
MDGSPLGSCLETALMSAKDIIKDSKWQPRRWYHRRDARFVLVILSLMAVFYSWSYITGPSRLSINLSKLLEKHEMPVNLVITTNFPAQEFHLGVFQEAGTIRGSKGLDTLLYKVKPKDIRMLSRKYWVERINVAPPLDK